MSKNDKNLEETEEQGSQVDAMVSWPEVGQEVEDIFSGKIGTVIETYEENGFDYATVDWGLFEKDVSTKALKKIDSLQPSAFSLNT